jgi:hypothetical protein
VRFLRAPYRKFWEIGRSDMARSIMVQGTTSNAGKSLDRGGPLPHFQSGRLPPSPPSRARTWRSTAS